MAAEDEDYALAIGRAIKTVDPDIIYVALFGSKMQWAAEKLGLPLAREGFVDRMYYDDGNLASRALSGVKASRALRSRSDPWWFQPTKTISGGIR
jgi:UPF0271 protein